jgi:hypothetical protein
MQDLYRIFANPDNTRIIAMILSGVSSLGVVVYFLSNAKRAHLRLTNTQRFLVIAFGIIAFFSGLLTVGYLIVPKNSDNLLDLFGIRRVVDSYTQEVQRAILWLIHLAM